MDASDVAVTCEGTTLSSAKVSVDGQRLTVAIDDATALRGKTMQISYNAKLRSGAELGPYLNAEGNVASVPYQAHTSFDDESKVVSSQVESVKFRVSAAKGSSAGATKSSLAKTGDAMSYAVPAALAELAAAMLALAARRRMRD